MSKKQEDKVVWTGQPPVPALIDKLNEYLRKGWNTGSYESGMWLLHREVKANESKKKEGRSGA